MKVALYARYSSDNQRDASIEDQLRLCRLHAEKQGWTIVDSYSDRAISGASLLRPGIQELIQDATRGRFAIVVAEAMDRLSRDQEDIAGLFKRMAFAGVRIVTLSEGDVTHLHVGLKGTMNALFLKDLADKTRRARCAAGSRTASPAADCASAMTSSSNSRRMANQSAAIERSTRLRPPSSVAFSPITSPANRPARSPLS
jgi:DNA invertase Pin-like site-specific DNA recombinase